MGLYDIDFSKNVSNMLPPDKRFSRNIAWMKILTYPLQYLNYLWFRDYRTGSQAPYWSALATYGKYDQVIYNKIVYESLIDANTSTPTTVSSWKVVQQNFIGLFERIEYNGQKLVLEYALNTWFGTTFRQPPNVSDIYVTNNSIGIPVFRVGNVEDISSSVSNQSSSEFVINAYTISIQFNIDINVPVAVYNALDPSLVNNEAIFRSFADKYIPAGLTYTIVTY
jgi:hypothetical protein